VSKEAQALSCEKITRQPAARFRLAKLRAVKPPPEIWVHSVSVRVEEAMKLVQSTLPKTLIWTVFWAEAAAAAMARRVVVWGCMLDGRVEAGEGETYDDAIYFGIEYGRLNVADSYEIVFRD
jgi:hypothetical protein